MKKSYYEIVIEGHFSMVKGFIYGLLEGSKGSGIVLFSREHHIETKTLSELFKELIHLSESLCHVIIEEQLMELIKKGVKNTFEVLNLQIKESKKIKKASFSFHFEVYAKKYGKEIKNIFENLPEELKISDNYQPNEEIYPECKGMDTLAPCHDYNLTAHGSVEGPIDVLLPFYKKIQAYEFIKEDDIILHF